MKTLHTITITPVFCEDDVPQIPSEYAADTVYVSEKYNRISFNCLCGCGAFTMLPVNQRPEGWQLEIHSDKSITLHGSVLQGRCKAHYVINKNKVNFLP